MTSARTNVRQVGVFRLQLFKPSESFILNQAHSYTRWEPTFIGRMRHGPDQIGVATVLPKFGAVFNTLAMLNRDPSAYVRQLSGKTLDLLHAHFAVDAVYAAPLARRLDIPLVTTLHGFDVSTRDAVLLASGRAPLIQAVIWRKTLQATGQLFVAVSEAIRRQAIARGFPAKRTRTLPIGIDLERLAPDGRPSRPGLVVHVARLVEKKGTSILLNAFSQVAASRPHAQLEIVGDGPFRARLLDQAQRLGVGGKVNFRGALAHAETLDIMRRATVIAVPSVTAASGDCEGLPTVIFEAGALGLPVVASRTAGIPEAVDDGATGFLTPERDVGALADRLGVLLDHPEAAAAMGAAARQKMHAHFDVHSQTARLEEWYDEMVDRWRRDRARAR